MLLRAPLRLRPPAVATGILDKPLSKLVADIVRAQAQQPPPGYDPETVAEVQAAAAAATAAASGGAPAAQTQAPAAAATTSAGGEGELRSKLQDYVMLNPTGGESEAAPMSLDQLKEQVGVLCCSPSSSARTTVACVA